MFWLYLVTDRAGSWAVLHSRAVEEAPPDGGMTVVERVGCFESAKEAIDALVQLEGRLARGRRRVRPSLRFGPRPLGPSGH